MAKSKEDIADDSVRVMLAEDEEILRETLRMSLEGHNFSVVGEAADGIEAVSIARACQPDVVVLDVNLPKLTGIEAAARIHDSNPALHILMLSAHRDCDFVIRAVRAGALGYVWKASADFWELRFAIKAVAKGHAFISPEVLKQFIQDYVNHKPEKPGRDHITGRQKEVLLAVSSGLSNKEIAETLRISVKTVEKHRTRLMETLRVHNSAGLVRHAFEKGLMK
jgi:DNA-binding NarL/FixJ family response regulator